MSVMRVVLRPLARRAASRPATTAQQRGHSSMLRGRGGTHMGSWLDPAGGGARGVCGALIGANLGVYGLWQLQGPYDRLMNQNFVLNMSSVVRRPWTLVTHVFSHQDGWHLFGNCLTLFFFGPEVALAMGAKRFLGLYATSGLVAAAAQLASNPRGSSLGASGAINGVVAFSVLAAPWRLIIIPIEFIPIPMPAIAFGAMFVGKDALALWNEWNWRSRIELPFGSRVGHGAHLGGALVGVAAFVASRGRFRM